MCWQLSCKNTEFIHFCKNGLKAFFFNQSKGRIFVNSKNYCSVIGWNAFNTLLSNLDFTTIGITDSSSRVLYLQILYEVPYILYIFFPYILYILFPYVNSMNFKAFRSLESIKIESSWVWISSFRAKNRNSVSSAWEVWFSLKNIVLGFWKYWH